MLFGKKDHLVGLDIGSRTIKAAEIIESNKGRTLKRFGMTDIKPGLIEDGAINEPEEVAEAVSELFKSFGVREKNVAISIGGYSVIVKKINVQTMAEDVRTVLDKYNRRSGENVTLDDVSRACGAVHCCASVASSAATTCRSAYNPKLAG